MTRQRLELIALVTVLGSMSCSEDGGGGTRPGDTVPPGAIQDLSVERIADDRVLLYWTAPGDDGYAGQASRYDLRYANTAVDEPAWEQATQVTSVAPPRFSGSADSAEVGGLDPGRWYFALRVADEERNWSEISNTVSAELGDTIPPAPVELALFAVERESVTLTWSAPGDDGAAGRADAYDVRFAEAIISDVSWGDAVPADGALTPSEAGSREVFTVTGLAEGRRYYFGVVALDDGGNRSPLSNIVEATTARDTTGPAEITDLEVQFAAGRAVDLVWTAPGDDGNRGQAARYDLRYADGPITLETWDTATSAEVPSPAAAGSREEHVVEGLALDATYHFAIRAVDDADNWSGLFNSVVATTASQVVLTQSVARFGVQSCDWEPNGGRIAFSRLYMGEQSQVFLIDTRGGPARQLTMHPDGVYHPRWSPLSDQLACVVFKSVGTATRQGIGLMDPAHGASPNAIFVHDAGAVRFPAWSPDGDRIAYVHSRIGDPIQSIMIVNASGGTPATVYSDPSNVFGIDWSTDGQSLLFGADRSGSVDYDLWRVPASVDGSPVQVTDFPGMEVAPVISPDGQQVLFNSDQGGGFNLWVMPLGGGKVTQLTDVGVGESATSPAWAPAGDAIAFVLVRDGIGDVAILYLPE